MNHNSYHLRQYYTCLVFADDRKTARRIWRDICRMHSSGRCSPAERQSAFISLQNEVRDAAIYGADRLYSEHSKQLPETMLAYQNALSFLFGSSLDSMPRCGDYELSAQYRPMILSSIPAQWLTNDSLAEWVVGERREVKMAG